MKLGHRAAVEARHEWGFQLREGGNRLGMELPEMGSGALDGSQMLSRGWMPERNNEVR